MAAVASTVSASHVPTGLFFFNLTVTLTLLFIFGFCCETVCSEYFLYVYHSGFASLNCLQKFFVSYVNQTPKERLAEVG